MSLANRFALAFKAVLPAPFTIAVLLSIVTYFIALFATCPSESSYVSYGVDLMFFWESGLWTNSLMVFAVQMMLMLVLGHVLALTKPVDRFISWSLQFCTSNARAVAWISFFTLLLAFFNWGLGLIFGAIYARKIAEYAKKKSMPINYPLIGAAAYSGMMVWHGGLSGSSLVKAAEPGHLREMLAGNMSMEQLSYVPDFIGFEQSVFSNMNIVLSLILLFSIPLFLFLLAKLNSTEIYYLKEIHSRKASPEILIAAEKLDHSRLLALFFAAVVLGAVCIKVFYAESILSFFTPNNINFLLLGLALMFHGSFASFLSALEKAIGGISGILIQFPLYFGIMGIMNSSGLVDMLSAFFVSISSEFSLPIYVFFSAGLVNIFVPSGGGQWAVQGPVILQAALSLGAPLNKCIMAFAYGDQVTNMLQPFWALPLLGITGLKAKQILPYTLLLFVFGALCFMVFLLVF